MSDNWFDNDNESPRSGSPGALVPIVEMPRESGDSLGEDGDDTPRSGTALDTQRTNRSGT